MQNFIRKNEEGKEEKGVKHEIEKLDNTTKIQKKFLERLGWEKRENSMSRDVNVFIFLKNDRFLRFPIVFFVSFSDRFKNYRFFKKF